MLFLLGCWCPRPSSLVPHNGQGLCLQSRPIVGRVLVEVMGRAVVPCAAALRGQGGLGKELSLLVDREGGLQEWAAFCRKWQWGSWKGCALPYSPWGGMARALKCLLSSAGGAGHQGSGHGGAGGAGHWADGRGLLGLVPGAAAARDLLHCLPTLSCCHSA